MTEADLTSLSRPFSSFRSKSSFQIDDVVKESIIEAIWGENSKDPDFSMKLTHWFEYYGKQTSSASNPWIATRQPHNNTIRAPSELISIIRILNSSPGKTRQELRDATFLAHPNMDLDG